MKFTIQGEPTGKARPRITQFSKYTPEKTVLYENLVKTEYAIAKGKMHEGQITMTVTAFYAIPKGDSKKVRLQKQNGEIRPTKKPDCDNVLKIIADALNKIAYNDDSQIVDARISKHYGNVPRVEIEISEVI